MRSFVTLLLSLPALAAAQFATDCGDATQAKFNRCVSNVISVEAMVWGQLTPGTTLENACNDVRKNEAVYNCCLCESYTVVHRTCYNPYCMASPSISTIQQQAAQYCNACPPEEAARHCNTTCPVPGKNTVRRTTTLPFPTLSGTLSAVPTVSPSATAAAGSMTSTPAPAATGAAKNGGAANVAGLGGAVFGGVVGLLMA